MAQIKKFFECLIPVSVCNLECDYCYIIQRHGNMQKVPQLKYSPEHIGQSLTQKRLGGVCYFSLCGAGETFVPDYLTDIVFQLLKNGHYVNVTTNGTLTKKIQKLGTLPPEYCSRLHISFSLHFLELKKRSLLDTFFANIEFVRSLGCSVLVQLNVYDGYLEHLEEIRNLCISRTGAPPQLVATRKETSLNSRIDLMTSLSHDDYLNSGSSFDSPLFDYTVHNINKRQRGFCYAGDWSYVLNMQTGIMKRCYASCLYQNIFSDPDKPLMSLAVGRHCASLYCLNASHFLTLGTIADDASPSYAQLRNRPEASWYSDDMDSFLNTKLCEQNKQYSLPKRCLSGAVGTADYLMYHLWTHLKNKKK
ncbi:MAG: radical SAM protein [Oscillospiraceae bacterium]|nr:radical SAM protein [Oscillospiraceae bacterium]